MKRGRSRTQNTYLEERELVPIKKKTKTAEEQAEEQEEKERWSLAKEP